MPVEHFQSPESYRKYRAYTHIHGIPTHAKEVVVGGKRHTVHHHTDKKLGKRKTKVRARTHRKRAGKRA